MPQKVYVLVGTKKGVFILESDEAWSVMTLVTARSRFTSLLAAAFTAAVLSDLVAMGVSGDGGPSI